MKPIPKLTMPLIILYEHRQSINQNQWANQFNTFLVSQAQWDKGFYRNCPLNHRQSHQKSPLIYRYDENPHFGYKHIQRVMEDQQQAMIFSKSQRQLQLKQKRLNFQNKLLKSYEDAVKETNLQSKLQRIKFLSKLAETSQEQDREPTPQKFGEAQKHVQGMGTEQKDQMNEQRQPGQKRKYTRITQEIENQIKQMLFKKVKLNVISEKTEASVSAIKTIRNKRQKK